MKSSSEPQRRKSSSASTRHVWVDVELLHWVAEPDPDFRGSDGGFDLKCLYLYVYLCATSMQQAVDYRTSHLLRADTDDVSFLISLGLDPKKYVIPLGILRIRGLIRPYGAGRITDIGTTGGKFTLDKRAKGRDEAELDSVSKHYEIFEAEHGEVSPEVFLQRLWTIHMCDGNPRHHQNPEKIVKAYVRLSGKLFSRTGGGSAEYTLFSPEEMFLILLLHQGTRPVLTMGIHPSYLSKDSHGRIQLKYPVRQMCDAAGIKNPEEVIQRLIERRLFTWIRVPFAAQKVESSERASAITFVPRYDARYPDNRDSLDEMKRDVLVPVRHYFVSREDSVWEVLEQDLVDIDIEDSGVERSELLGGKPL